MTGSVAIQDRFDVTVLAPDGPARLRRSALPSPLHLAGALASLPPAVAARAGERRAGRARAAAGRPGAARPGQVRLGDLLAARGQSERARRLLWDLFMVSALNIAGDDASVPLAATVVRTGLLGGRGAADIGMATVPLGQLHDTAAGCAAGPAGRDRAPAGQGGRHRSGPGGGYRVRLTQADPADGEPGDAGDSPATLHADGVVLAVPPARRPGSAPRPGCRRPRAGTRSGTPRSSTCTSSTTQPVMDLPFAAAVDSPVQWVFDRTRPAGLPTGQYLAVSLSAADEYIDVRSPTLREQFVPALARLFPAAASTEITDFFVTRERRATFRQAPGCARLRPGTATPVPGLVLAGAWTDTGWPDTMEGAVRSGNNAADASSSASCTAADRSDHGCHAEAAPGQVRRMTVTMPAGSAGCPRSGRTRRSRPRSAG